MSGIACVGILVADVIVKPVTHLPERGKLSYTDSIGLFPGGNAMTAALNLAKQGVKVSLTGMVGQDHFGDFLLRTAREGGVCTGGVKQTERAQTSSSVLMIGEDGERSYFHCPGANGIFSIRDIDRSVIQEASTVFVTGSFLMDTFDGAETAEFFKRCKEERRRTALDVCWDGQGRWGRVLNEALPYVDVFLPSLDEAQALTGKETVEDMAEVLFARGVGCVVIKLGAEGCYLQERREQPGRRIPALRGISCVDATGAGDSFCSGFLAALEHGMNFQQAAEYANAAGGLSVTCRGASTAIQSYEQVLQFMEEHK